MTGNTERDAIAVRQELAIAEPHILAAQDSVDDICERNGSSDDDPEIRKAIAAREAWEREFERLRSELSMLEPEASQAPP